MDSPIDNPFDLGLVNFVKHPSDPDYIVFRFADINRANDFEKTLKERKIWFEKGEEARPARTYYLFGVRNRDYDIVQKINYEVEARNRNYIIGNKVFRWSLILFMTALITLAAVGYCSAPH